MMPWQVGQSIFDHAGHYCSNFACRPQWISGTIQMPTALVWTPRDQDYFSKRLSAHIKRIT